MDEDDAKKILDLRRQGWTQRSIADHLNLTMNRVFLVLKANGMTTVRRSKRGENPVRLLGMPLLDANVRDIRNRIARGDLYGDIAKDYDVSQGTFSRWLRIRKESRAARNRQVVLNAWDSGVRNHQDIARWINVVPSYVWRILSEEGRIGRPPRKGEVEQVPEAAQPVPAETE